MLEQILFSQATVFLSTDSRPSQAWMMENGAECYDMVNGLLLRATLTSCCGIDCSKVISNEG